MRNNLLTWRSLLMTTALALVSMVPLKAVPWSVETQQELNRTQLNLNSLGTNTFTGNFEFNPNASNAFAPEVDCLNTTAYGTVAAPSGGNAPITITSCNFAGEYATVTGAAAGAQYQFGSSITTDYLTIRQGTSSGPILGQGTTPVTVTNPTAGNLYVHVNTDSNCGTASSCRATTVACVSCLPPPACTITEVTTYPFTETFEADSPNRQCWSNELVSGTVNWTYRAGAQGGGAVTTAHLGVLNASFYAANNNGNTTKLNTPKFNFTGKENATLNFWYANQDWVGDQNILNIYYKTSAGGAWTLIPGATYNTSVAAWTEVTLSLPDSQDAAEYYLAFEGFSDYGRGIVLDDVVVDADDMAPTACLTAVNGQWPSSTITPTCSGLPFTVTSTGWASEFSKVNVTAGETYTFQSSVATDYITISNDGGTVAYASGVGPLVWTASATEVVRFYLHADAACGTSNVNRIRAVTCGAIPTEQTYACDQSYSGVFSQANSVNKASNFALANDFFVPMTSEIFKLEKVTLLLVIASTTSTINDFGAFDLALMNDNAGAPGTSITSFPGLTPSSVTENTGNTFAGYKTYFVTFDIPAGGYELTVNPAADTRYWLSASGATTTSQNVFWVGYQRASTWLTSPNYQSTDNGATYNVVGSTSTLGTFDSTWSFDATCEQPDGCLDAPNGQYPSAIYVPICAGIPISITTIGWAGEYSVVSLTAGTEYTFSSSIATDYITISDEAGTVVKAFGTTPVVYTPAADENVRFYTHADENCTANTDSRSRMVQCGTPVIIEEPTFPCFQGDGITSSFDDGYSVNPTNIYRVADDFTVAADTQFTINQITIDVLSMTDVTSATFNVRADNAGVPGAVSETVTMAPTSSVTYNVAYGFPVRHLTFDLATALDFTEGTYWLEPTLTNSDATTVYWLVTSTGSNGAVLQTSSDSGTTWTADANSYQAVFFVAGECNPVAEGCLTAGNGQYPSATFTPSCIGAPETITTVGWAGEYSKVNVTAGTQYTFASSIATDFITISDEAGTVSYAAGITPVVWTAPADAVVRFYTHADDACTENTDIRARSVMCGTIQPPPANDDCANAIAIACGGSESGNTVFATNSGGTAAPDVFYTFTGTGTPEMVTVSLCGSAYDTRLSIFSDCTLTNEIMFNDDSCGLQSELTFLSDGTSTYVIMVDGYAASSYGAYTLNVTCAAPPEFTCEEQFVNSNNLENGSFFGGDTSQLLAVDVPVGNAGFTTYGVDLNVFVDGNTDLEFFVSFIEDEAGLPGTNVVASGYGEVVSSELVGNAFGYDVYKYRVKFAAPVDLAANTTYWMQVESDGLAWESTSVGILGSGMAFNNTNTSGVWTLDSASDLVYQLICEELGVGGVNSFDFTYYPNPVKDVLNITSQKAVKSVEAYNLAGQKVMSSAKVNNGQVDVNALTSGTYVFKVTLEGGQVETFKIIKK